MILLEMDLAGPLIKLSDSTSVISSLYVNHGLTIYRKTKKVLLENSEFFFADQF